MFKNYWKYVFLLLIKISLHAQNPAYFQTSIDDGLPSNEVYSIVEDRKGFIWIGCDAGLYKYDGVRFHSYKSKKQKTKAITGLCVSSSGKIYCYNFSGQIFYIENDSLQSLSSWNGKVSNIVCDKKNNLWVCGEKGINRYNELEKSWVNYSDFNSDGIPDKYTFTNSCRISADGSMFANTDLGVISINKTKLTLYAVNYPSVAASGEYILESYKSGIWLFKVNEGICYHNIGSTLTEYKSKFLYENLRNSKITCIKELDDGLIWICTYSGIISYNPSKDTGNVFFTNMAFSNITQDKEKSYWLTTLHDGLLRIADINSKNWNTSPNGLSSNKILKLAQANPNIYFSSLNGQIGYINTISQHLQTFNLDTKSDIRNMIYSPQEQRLYFNAQNTLYYLQNNRIVKINSRFPPAKDLCYSNNAHIVATSRGCFLYENLESINPSDTLTKSWSRSIAIDSTHQHLWLATNDGLISYRYIHKKWQINRPFLIEKQVLSITYSNLHNSVYAITFDGELYRVDAEKQIKLIQQLPQDVQANQIYVFNKVLYLATNHGLWKLDLKTNTWSILDKLTGLSSNEILSVSILNNTLWLATANGLQMIPVNYAKKVDLSKIYLKQLLIDSRSSELDTSITINYNQNLTVVAEAIAYSSNRNFKYAYRLSNNDSNWITLPSSIDKIQIPSLPTGDFKLEIKLIDYLQRDSENRIIITGKVIPPFWQRWWFYALISLVVLGLAFLFFKYRIKQLRKKQLNELKQLQLENDLRFSQETALKAQMNPHFLFNVLNSIKGYIYENDKKNATLYLSSFSDLVRKILIHSSSPDITLKEEIDILKLYIELEAMLIQNDFKYTITTDKQLNLSNIKIPALLIQPYIENAFKHGLRHKPGQKELQIDFRLNVENNYLTITISDNGIGRNASAQLKSSSKNAHQSFATDATSKRIALLNSNKKDIINVQLIDRFDNENNPTGTSVVLTIHLNQIKYNEGSYYR